MATLTDQPIVVPAVPAMTFSEVAVRSLVINFPDPNGAIPVTITYGLISRDENGAGTYLDDFSPVLSIPDLLAEAATDPDMASVFNAVLTKLMTLAATRGIISIASS